MFRIVDNEAVADVACVIEAPSLGDLFREASKAFVAVQTEDPSAVVGREPVSMSLHASAVDLLLYKFLQELVYWKDAKRRFVMPGEVIVRRDGDHFHLTAEMRAAKIDPKAHRLTVDVKAATLHRLYVRPKDDDWEASFVLDI